jgi:hypothetical protein
MDVRIFDEMIPWERDLMLNMMIREIEEENLEHKLKAQQQRVTGKR